VVGGHGAANEPDPCIKIYDCGPNKICYQVPDDLVIGHGGTNAAGFFSMTLTRPLVPGEEIYSQDDCVLNGGVIGPAALRGPIVVVTRPAPAPTLSPAMIVVLAATLSLVGLFGLARVRRNQ
jgi:hypothetical protein